MKKILHRDTEGVESIPLKLIIVILVLAIIIPSFFMGLAAYSNSQTENNIQSEIDRIVSLIKQTYDGDEGTSYSLSINIEEGIFKKLEYVKIGDKIGEHGGPHQCIIRYKFYNEDVCYVVIEKPNIMTASPLNAAFEMGSGKFTIIAQKYMIGDVGFVVVRTQEEDIHFKMADLAIYKDDITITNRDDDLPGLMIGVTIHNIGTLNTSDEKAKWSGDGKIQVNIFDRLVLAGEIRTVYENLTIDDITAGGVKSVSVEWFPIQEGDDPQDTKLRKREIIVIVDAWDNVDELTFQNNKVKKDYEAIPPVINYVKAAIDDNAPGIGIFVVGVDAMNTVEVHAADADGWVRQVSFWWGDKSYPKDSQDPSYLDDTREDGFKTTINMGEFEHTTNITFKAYDNAGFGGDPFNETIYMEIVPEWMNIAETRATEEGGKNFDFDTDNRTFKLIIDVPGDLMEGFKGTFGGDLPFISQENNEMSNQYQLELEIPLGGNVSFRKETDFISELLSKKLGSKVDGSASIEATLHVGLDKGVEINLSKIFDLVNNARYLLNYWEQYKDILYEVDWQGIKNPGDVNELISALADAYEKVKDRPEFSELNETITNIKETIEYYQECYSEIEDLWISIMNYKNDPESLLKLVSFEAKAQITLGKKFDYTLFKSKHPIFPPFVECEVQVDAYLNPSFIATAGLQGDLTGLEFGYVDISSSVAAGLNLSAEVKVGLNFGVAGGGISGEITGNPELDLTAGMNYSTTMGFTPYFYGTFRITLWASLQAYAEFIGWRKDWTFWDDAYTLGEWEFDLVDGTTTRTKESDTQEKDAQDFLNMPGNITLPRGPVTATDEAGHTLIVGSNDRNHNPDNPNYEIIYYTNYLPFIFPLTSNTKIEAEPALVYNSTDYAFVIWTQCADNQDLTNTTLEINDFLGESEIYYAILKGIAVVEGPSPLYSPNMKPDYHPSIAANPNGNVTVSWIRDDDGDITTGEDQQHYYSIWNGTDWSSPELKLDSGSYDYNTRMAYVSDGRIVSTWIHDADENLYTTEDQQIFCSVYSEGEWSTSEQLTFDNSSKEFISLCGNGEEIILVWLVKEDDYLYKILSKTWDKETGLWSSTETINTSSTLVQNPEIVVTDNGTAILVWRSNYEIVNWSNPDEGWIYCSSKNLLKDSNWTKPRKIALTNAPPLEFYSSLTLINDSAFYSYTNSTSQDNWIEALKNITIKLKPDLYVTQVLVNGSNNLTAEEGEIITITAKVSNSGDLKGENINISFFDGNPEIGGELIGSIFIENLNATEDSEVQIQWQVLGGIHNIYVVADPNDMIPEHDEKNNLQYCTIICLPDSCISSDDVTFSSSTPNEGDEIEITAEIHNQGQAAARDVLVKFYNGNPENGAALIGTKLIQSIEKGGERKAIIVWVVPSGIQNIFVDVEVDEDVNQLNNLASNTLSILPDLAVNIGDLKLSDSEILENEDVNISVTVHNQGRANIQNAIVKFCTSDSFIGYDVVTIPVDTSQTISIDWKPPKGSHLVYVVLDPGNQILELDETNNLQAVTLTVLPSLDLSTELELEGKDNGKVKITANITNSGSSPSINVSVSFYEGNPQKGGTLINSIILAKINGKSSSEHTFEWQTSSGRKTIYAVVDEMDLIRETDEMNNVQFKTIDMKGESSKENIQWPFILLIIIIIAVPVIIIIFYWRRRLSH